MESDDSEPLRFRAPRRLEAKRWAVALELSAGYVEANVDETSRILVRRM